MCTAHTFGHWICIAFFHFPINSNVWLCNCTECSAVEHEFMRHSQLCFFTTGFTWVLLISELILLFHRWSSFSHLSVGEQYWLFLLSWISLQNEEFWWLRNFFKWFSPALNWILFEIIYCLWHSFLQFLRFDEILKQIQRSFWQSRKEFLWISWTKKLNWNYDHQNKWTNRRNYQRKTILEASFPNGLGHIICLNCFEWFQMVSSLHNKWLFLNSNCYLAVTYLMLNSFSKIDVEKWVDFEIFHKNCCPNSLFFGLKMFFE